MKINIGLCLMDVNVPGNMMWRGQEYEEFFQHVVYKISYIKKHIDRLHCIGADHVRIPNILSNSYNHSNFNQLLRDPRVNLITKGMSRLPVDISMHAPYWVQFGTSRDRLNAKTYMDNNNKLMNLMGIREYTVVCHVGNGTEEGVNKPLANFLDSLRTKVRRHIVLENDETFNNIEDCIRIGKNYNCPVVFDNLHNKVNKSVSLGSYEDMAKRICEGWVYDGLPMKLHYSNGNENGKHYNYIDFCDLRSLLDAFSKHKDEITIMFEIGDSQLEISSMRIMLPQYFK